MRKCPQRSQACVQPSHNGRIGIISYKMHSSKIFKKEMPEKEMIGGLNFKGIEFAL